MKSRIASFIVKIQLVLYYWIVRAFCSVKPYTIVFQGKPDYSDNPRALCDFLLSQGYGGKYKIYYMVSNNFKEQKISHGNKVHFFYFTTRLGFLKLSSCKILLTSQYVFTSHAFKIPMHKGLQGQKYITLWHGCGYKNNEGSKLEFNRFFDLALVPGPLFVKTKSKCWNTTRDYLLAKGYPRYDWLLHPTGEAKLFMDNFKKIGKKVVVWMPTYRNSIVDGTLAENVIVQFPLIKSEKDWNTLDEICRNNSVVILVKLHMSQKNYGIDFSRLTNVIQLSNKDFDEVDVQMYEFLALTDGLISDYSSVAVDYLVVNKPLAFALDDFDLYKKARGFVFDNPKDYMPGHHLYNVQDLCDYVTDVAVGNDKYAAEREKMSDIAIYKSSNYCKDIVNSIGL